MKNFTRKFKLFTLAAALLSMSAGVTGQVLTETFDGLAGNSTTNNGSSTAWNGNDNFPTVDRAYQAGEAVKLGTGSAVGSITTKELDLSGNGGYIRVVFDVKGWTNIEGNIVVSLVGGAEDTVTYTAKMADYFETKEVIFASGGSANTQVKLATSAKRAFLDNIKIYNSSSTTASVSGGALTFDITKAGTTANKSINIKGSNLSGDLTLTGLSAPFSSTVTTITKAEAEAAEGFNIPIEYKPTTRGAHSGAISISGGGLESAVNINISGFADGELTASDFNIASAVTSLSADFEDVVNNIDYSLTGWKNINVKGERLWQGKTLVQGEATDRYIQATAFSSSNPSSAEYEIWMITPAINFSALPSGSQFSFGQAVIGTVPETSFEVHLLKVNGSTIEKTKLSIDKQATVSKEWVDTKVDISGIEGVGFIGFRYNRVAGTTNAASYRLDNIKLGVSTAVTQPSANKNNIYVLNNQIVVKAENGGALIEIFNIAGQKVTSKTAEVGLNQFTVAKGQIYIVKFGPTIKKLVL